MSQLVVELIKCLPHVRASFYESGFELPHLYLAAIEAMRHRHDDELDYQHYLDEVLSEYIALPYPWQPSVRHLLHSRERSVYLDTLAARSVSNFASLDPNFNLFVKDESWLDSLNRFRRQKQEELERHSTTLSEIVGGSSSYLIDDIVQIAGRHGYHPKYSFKRRDEALILESIAAQHSQISMKVIDLPTLEKRGNVIIQYFFDELPDKPFGLDTFVPGGHLYSEWNKTPRAILFSFYVQCRFAVSLCTALGATVR